MHLAIVTPYPPAITGIGQYGYHVSKVLVRTGAFERVTLLTSRAAGAASFDPVEGLEIERVWEPDRLDAGWRIVARLRQLKPDLVWYNLGVSAFGRSALANIISLHGPAVTRNLGFPSVITLHEMVETANLRALRAPGGPLARLGARWITFIATRADVVCVTLHRNAEFLARRWPRLPIVHIVNGGYDQPEWLAEPECSDLLIFTTFAPFKGLELLLETFARLRSDYPDLRLTIAGAEHPRWPGYLNRVQREYSDLPSVHWLGSLPESGLREIFLQAAIVVLPYTATTGSSSVLSRAASWGRVVVVSDLPELRAAADEAGLQAEYFRSGDQQALIQALDRLLSDPKRRLAIARHNFRAISHYTPDATAKAYLHAFDLALTTRHYQGQVATLE
jgi:glycosyltransferase involved in cell wall biosynthesis